MDASFWGSLFSAVGKVATTKIPMIGEGQGQMNGTTEAIFDNSGWNIAFDGSSITSTAEKTIDQGATSAGGSQPGLQYPYGAGTVGAGVQASGDWLLYGAVFIVVVLALKKRKGA